MTRQATAEDHDEALRSLLDARQREIQEDRRGRREARLHSMGFSPAAIKNKGALEGLVFSWFQDHNPYFHGIKPEDAHDRKSGRKRAKKLTLRRTYGLYHPDTTP